MWARRLDGGARVEFGGHGEGLGMARKVVAFETHQHGQVAVVTLFGELGGIRL
jgi:hypothetical protein